MGNIREFFNGLTVSERVTIALCIVGMVVAFIYGE